MLSLLQIENLLSQKAISELYPWGTQNCQLIDDFYRNVCATVVHDSEIQSRVEWDHYGSGYASFIDAWFYKASPEFTVDKPVRYGEEFIGLVVLLSRLSPYFVFMEGEKHWHSHGGSSYMPDSTMVDKLSNESVKALAIHVQLILESHGLIRVSKENLMMPLPNSMTVPTILTDSPHTYFDTLFYWED